MISTLTALAVGLILPLTPVAGYLGFVSLPFSFFPFLTGAVVVYLVLVDLAKRSLLPQAQSVGPGMPKLVVDEVGRQGVK